MKTLKTLALVAVFCLTVSVITYNSQPSINPDEILKIDKDDFKITGEGGSKKGKIKKQTFEEV